MGDVDAELMVVSDENQFLKNYKAVYNAMTAKPDCRSKAYPKRVVVDLEDIYDLNGRIFEKFRTQYEDAGFSVNIIVSIKGRQKLEFPNWKSFEEHKWVETEIIIGMVLVWEFNVKLPKYSVPQKHTLMVKLSNGIRPEEVFGLIISGKLDEIEEIDQGMCPIVARMDFIDSGIGNEVLEIVSDWTKGLKNSDSKRGGITVLLQRNKRKFAYALNYFTSFVALLCSVIIINNFLIYLPIQTMGELKNDQACAMVNLLFVCMIGWFIVKKISELISNAIFQILTDYGNEHIFNITKGDKKQQDEFRKAERNDRKKIVVNLGITVLINIICGIATYFLTKGM